MITCPKFNIRVSRSRSLFTITETVHTLLDTHCTSSALKVISPNVKELFKHEQPFFVLTFSNSCERFISAIYSGYKVNCFQYVSIVRV